MVSLNVRFKVTPEADSSETKEGQSEVKASVLSDLSKVNSSKADTTANPAGENLHYIYWKIGA